MSLWQMCLDHLHLFLLERECGQLSRWWQLYIFPASLLQNLSTCGELFSSQCNASITYLGATVELETHVGLSFVKWSLISWAQLLHKVRPLIFLALSFTHNSGSNCFRWYWCYIKCGYCFWMGLFQRKPLWQRYQRKGLRFQLQPQELAVKWTWVSWERFFEDKLEYYDTFPRCLQPGYVKFFLFKGQLE